MGDRKTAVMKGPLERFCQLMAIGKTSQVDCWIDSHPGTILRRHSASEEARRALKLPEVLARIKEIREPAVAEVRKKIKYEMEDAFEELKDAMIMATANGEAGVMKGIVELKAKLAGLVIARSEKVERPLDDATTEELVLMRAEIKRQKMKEEGEPLMKAVEAK